MSDEVTTGVPDEALVDQSPDATIYADREGVIRRWNAAAERIFGYAAADALGKDLNIIVPEKLQDSHWTGYDRALAAGDTKYRGQSLPTRAKKADGSEIYVELSFAIVHGPDGAVAGALAQARDISERFERDRAMRRELREAKAALGPTAPPPS